MLLPRPGDVGPPEGRVGEQRRGEKTEKKEEERQKEFVLEMKTKPAGQLHTSALSPLTISRYRPLLLHFGTPRCPGNRYTLDQMKDEIFTLLGRRRYRAGHASAG